MAKDSKKTRRQKISESIIALPIVSAKVSNAEKAIGIAEDMAKNVKEKEVSDFILASVSRDKEAIERYNADVMFLRKQIFYHAGKLAEEMTVDQFAKFGDGLVKLLS